MSHSFETVTKPMPIEVREIVYRCAWCAKAERLDLRLGQSDLFEIRLPSGWLAIVLPTDKPIGTAALYDREECCSFDCAAAWLGNLRAKAELITS